jgi:hypothetical protein
VTFPGAACETKLDAGTCHGSQDVAHRAQAAACSSNAGASAGCNITPHDECLTDADCGAGKACVCQSPPPPGQPCPGGIFIPAGNVCVPADCRVDADCKTCGVCEADNSCGLIHGYHCQMPNDACYPQSSALTEGCVFQSSKWTLSAGCPG